MSPWKSLAKVLLLALAVPPAAHGLAAREGASAGTRRYVEAVRAPTGLVPGPRPRPVVVAIVDDGFRLSHEALAASVWTNPKELPGNGVDDDGNGFVDDVHGWDVSDEDAGVAPPEDRLAEYSHGTHLAGIVTQLAATAFGDRAPSLVQIMPVKALAFDADRSYIKDGYAGIRYAVGAGADVVLCAWSAGHVSPVESAILRDAHERGVLVVASAGNFPGGQEQFPAAHGSVLAVAALDDDGRKADRSNHGAFVDLSAPGNGILSAGALSDTDYREKEGTSPASAMVAAAAAIVRVQHPSYSPDQVTACLKDSAEAIDGQNPRYVAQLGAGALNVRDAVACGLFDEGREPPSVSSKPEGYLRYSGGGRPAAWTVQPVGPLKGLRFERRAPAENAGGALRFYSEGPSGARLVARHALSELPDSVFVTGPVVHVVFEPGADGAGPGWLMEYRAEPIDLSRLHCSGTRKLYEEGTLSDGSGPDPYAANSDCRWLITAPKGKVVHFEFSEFDTQAKVDQVLFFDGTATNADLMAAFSGPLLRRRSPPGGARSSSGS